MRIQFAYYTIVIYPRQLIILEKRLKRYNYAYVISISTSFSLIQSL